MLLCPNCRRDIPPNDFNVSTDQAYCRTCDLPFRYSELRANVWPDPTFDPEKRPRPLELVDDGYRLTIVYRRMSPVLLFLIPFFAIWSGGSMYAIYFRHWFAGADVPQQDAVFGIPFVLGTVVLAGIIAYLMFGKIVIRLDGGESWLFHGIGGFGPTKRFDSTAVDAIRLVDSGARVNEVIQDCIELRSDGKDVVRFGTWMTLPSKRFLAQWLAQQLLLRDGKFQFTPSPR